jgi:Family of unknown function (DUF6152)
MKISTVVGLGALLAIAPPTFGHHSFAEFNVNEIVEHEGEIVSVFWRNPHVRMSINVKEAGGDEVIWNMEAQDVNTLGRLGVSKDLIQPGQRVKFAGWRSTRQENYIGLTHLLLDGDKEIVMRMRMGPRWSNAALGGGVLSGGASVASATGDGIFRVWSFAATTPAPAFTRNPPLTPEAKAAYEAFDPITDDPVLRCVKPGMPEALTFIGPHPIEFIDQGDTILLRVESDDVTRVIHMDESRVEVQSPTPLGTSVGIWEDERTLVVRTTDISWPYIKLNGLVAVPQSTQSVITEYFRMSAGEARLTYSLTISDSKTFTLPVTAEDYHTWQLIPGAVIEPYECTLE